MMIIAFMIMLSAAMDIIRMKYFTLINPLHWISVALTLPHSDPTLVNQIKAIIMIIMMTFA